MVWRGLVRLIGAPLLALFAALLLSSGPVMAADPGCAVTVDPPSAVGGSVFTFTGTGFQPTQLLLQKGDGSPIVNDIDPGATNPWSQNVQSRAGDEGNWTATFVEDGGCSIAVDFQVTLTSTDMVSDLLSDQPNTSLPALFYMLVVGFGLAGGAFLSRRLGAARSDLRH
jgi:hypothetical protein